MELLAGGKVRSLPGAAEPFEGYLPAEALTTPADRRGLMLHARRVVDLRLGAPDGEVVGRLHPGALVSVAPDAAAGTWLVAVPRYTDANGGPLLAHVERDALGPEPRPIVPPVLPGEVHRDFSLTLWRDDASNAFVNRTLCGDFHVTEDRGRLRVTQYHAGVELTGRLDFSVPWSWGDRGEHGFLGRLVFRKDGSGRGASPRPSGRRRHRRCR